MKLKDMSDYYLMGLLTHGDYKTDLHMVQTELIKRLQLKSCKELLSLWKNSNKGVVHELLEYHLAERYQNYEDSYDSLSNDAKEYLEKVESIDAIVGLTYAKCEVIQQNAMHKYKSIMAEYLEYYDGLMASLYETEGSDLEMFPKNVVHFKEQRNNSNGLETKGTAKIYKISDFKSRRK